MEKLKVENLTEQELEEKMYNEIKKLIESSKKRVYIAVNTILLDLYWNIGKNIVTNFQDGKVSAKYGTHLLENLSIRLASTYGKSFSKRNLEKMRRFYIYYSIAPTLSAELS